MERFIGPLTLPLKTLKNHYHKNIKDSVPQDQENNAEIRHI